MFQGLRVAPLATDFCVGPDPKFRHRGGPHDDSAGLTQSGHYSAIRPRRGSECCATKGGGNTRDIVFSFDGNGHRVQWAELHTAGGLRIEGVGSRACFTVKHGDEGVERWVETCNAVQKEIRDLACSELPGPRFGGDIHDPGKSESVMSTHSRIIVNAWDQ